MKAGDLVVVKNRYNILLNARFPDEHGIIVEVCLPEQHRNGMHQIGVLTQQGLRWFPANLIEVISEDR